ncbi:hypothetical protein D3C76_03600 [compost metagenome]
MTVLINFFKHENLADQTIEQLETLEVTVIILGYEFNRIDLSSSLHIKDIASIYKKGESEYDFFVPKKGWSRRVKFDELVNLLSKAIMKESKEKL